MQIISAVLSGDTDAFEALVLENRRQVYNLALKMTKNEQDAYDISQEAFLKAFRSLDKFRGDSKFSVWLYRLTSNLCLDFLRAQKRREKVSLSYENDEDEQQELEIPDERFSPEKILEQNNLRESISSALDALPEDYRSIIVMREMDGLSYDEISARTGLELGTVKSRIFRARKKLCALLSKDGNFSGGGASYDYEAKGV
jgi:RNA polymerase sigma-70 factor (ECF subfamily)